MGCPERSMLIGQIQGNSKAVLDALSSIQDNVAFICFIKCARYMLVHF